MMADEQGGGEQESQGSTPPPEQPKAESHDPQKTTESQVQRTGAADAQKSGWETEKRAFIADLQKERKQRQDYERQVATYQGELAAEKRRVQALGGVSPQSKDEVDADAIRRQFGQYFPDLANLSKDDIGEIRKIL